MIESVHLQNFQSHSDTVLNLHPGINAITGDSDKGKSAVLRGLLWAVENNPQGDAHVSDWIKTDKGTIKAKAECRVTVKGPKGTLSRIRSSTMNGYEVNKQILEAIRTDVPAEVQEFFQLGDVNIQRQMDRPFLISYPSGEAARFLNRLVNLTDIDLAMTSIESQRRALRKECVDREASVASLKEKVAALDWVDAAAEAVLKARKASEKIEGLKARLESISSSMEEHRLNAMVLAQYTELCDKVQALITKASGISGQLAGISQKVNNTSLSLTEYREVTADRDILDPVCREAGEKIKKVELISADLITIRTRRNSVYQGLSSYYQIAPVLRSSGEISQAQGLLEQAQVLDSRIWPLVNALSRHKLEIQTVIATQKECPDAGLLDQASRKSERAERMKAALDALRKTYADLQQNITDFQEATIQLVTAREAIKELQAQMTMCPTCGQKLPEGHIHV